MEKPSRVHGLHRPFHPLQVLSWVIHGFNVLTYYGCSLSCLSPSFRIPVTVSFSILAIFTTATGYSLSRSDPTDPMVVKFKSTTDKNQALQIEEKSEKYCNFCKSPVTSSSKHCVRCNRCTVNFDHHCKWVNNCIGQINYFKFIVLIVLSFLLELFIVTLSSSIMAQGIADQETLNENIEELYGVQGFYYFIAVQALLVFEGGLCSCLLAYLLGLHAMLKFRGMTTYEYIVSKKRESKVMPKDKRCDTNSALNNNQSYNAKDLHRSLSRSDIDLRDTPR